MTRDFRKPGSPLRPGSKSERTVEVDDAIPHTTADEDTGVHGPFEVRIEARQRKAADTLAGIYRQSEDAAKLMADLRVANAELRVKLEALTDASKSAEAEQRKSREVAEAAAREDKRLALEYRSKRTLQIITVVGPLIASLLTALIALAAR